MPNYDQIFIFMPNLWYIFQHKYKKEKFKSEFPARCHAGSTSTNRVVLSSRQQVSAI